MSSFDLGNTVNSLANGICNAPFIGGVIASPIFTALFLVAFIVVIIMIIYKLNFKNLSDRKGIRAFLYILVASTSILFVHYYAVKEKLQATIDKTASQTVFENIQQGKQYTQNATPVTPRIIGGDVPAEDDESGSESEESEASESEVSEVRSDRHRRHREPERAARHAHVSRESRAPAPAPAVNIVDLSRSKRRTDGGKLTHENVNLFNLVKPKHNHKNKK